METDNLQILTDRLGKALSARQVAEYMSLDVKTVRKYYQQLGGIRVGSRILFFEKEIIDAIQAQSQVVCTGAKRGNEARKSVSHEEGSSGLGSRNAKKTLKRVVKEDRHNLY